MVSWQSSAELDGILMHVDGGEVRRLRPDDVVTQIGQSIAEQIPLTLQIGGNRLVVGVRHGECLGDGGLERSAIDVGEELLDGAHGAGERRRCAYPADLPAGNAECLACT